MKSNIFKLTLISFLVMPQVLVAETLESFIQKWRQEGYLIFTDPVKYDQLEPSLSLNAHTKMTLPLIFEPLISIASQQELQPVLATSWRISSDNNSIKVTIKPHHYFSDNTEVTAQDVVNSFRRVCQPGSQVFAELKGLSGCEEYAHGQTITPGVSAIGRYELAFKINCSPTTFLYQLSSPSAVVTKQTKQGLIGSGPYVLSEKKPNFIVLTKNQYSAKENLPKNPGVAIIYANQNEVLNMLKKEKLDGALMYRFEDILNFQDQHYKLVKINPVITEILVLNNQNFPFNKPIVRKALSSAIYNSFKHTRIPGAHRAYGIIPYGMGGSIDNAPPNSLAKITPETLFNEVPELKTRKATIVFHQLDDLKNNYESDLIINAAKQYNIEVKFNYHKDYASLEPLYLNHKLDGFLELYVFRNREAYSVLQFFIKAGENNANILDSNLDNMLKEAITSPSSHGRFQTYRRIAQHLQDEGIVIPLFYMAHGNVLSKCLLGTSDNFLFNPFIHIPQLYRETNCNT